jgi:hypothetical protein
MNALPRQHQHRVSNREQCGLVQTNFSLLSGTACEFLCEYVVLRASLVMIGA